MAERQIQCQNCGATLNNEDLNGLQCPYCGSKIDNVVESRERPSKKSYQVDGIIPFSRSEEEAKQTLAWQLADDMGVPIDVFNSLNIRAKKIFVPMWEFEGSFKSPWSCQKVVYRERRYKEDGKTKYESYKEYYPANGVAVGNFDIFVSGVKRDYDYIPSAKSKEFSPELIDSDAIIKDLDVSRDTAWKSGRIKSYIEYLANTELKKALPDTYEDLNSYYEYHYNHCACVLYPMYEVEFEYEGETYDNVVSGWSDSIMEELYAPKQETISHENDHDLIDVNDTSTVWSMGAWGAIFLILGVAMAIMAGTHSHNLSAIVAVLLSIMAFTFPFITYSRIEDEKKLRKAIANDREEHDRETRLRRLINEPLLQPYREDVEETSELNIDSQAYNDKVRKDKASNAKFKMVLVVMFILSVGLYFASAMVRSAQEHARLERIRSAYQQITPQLFFYDTKQEYGHLRQDLRTTLKNMGFVREDEKWGQIAHAHSSTAEIYTLYLDGTKIMYIIINNSYLGEVKDDIDDVGVRILTPSLIDEYVSSFKEQLMQCGFSSPDAIKKQIPASLSFKYASNAYLRIGNEIRTKEYFFEKLLTNWDAVKLSTSEYDMNVLCFCHSDIDSESSVEDEVSEEDTAMVDSVYNVPITEEAAAADVDEYAPEAPAE